MAYVIGQVTRNIVARIKGKMPGSTGAIGRVGGNTTRFWTR